MELALEFEPCRPVPVGIVGPTLGKGIAAEACGVTGTGRPGAWELITCRIGQLGKPQKSLFAVRLGTGEARSAVL